MFLFGKASMEKKEWNKESIEETGFQNYKAK